MCPKGDDPLTAHNGYKTVQLSVYFNQSGGILEAGMLRVQFNGAFAEMKANATSEECKTAFQSISTVGTVNCTLITSNIGSADLAYIVEILSFPVVPVENNYYTHYGNPSIDSFQCTGVTSTAYGGLSGSYCSFTDLTDSSATLPGTLSRALLYRCVL